MDAYLAGGWASDSGGFSLGDSMNSAMAAYSFGVVGSTIGPEMFGGVGVANSMKAMAAGAFWGFFGTQVLGEMNGVQPSSLALGWSAALGGASTFMGLGIASLARASGQFSDDVTGQLLGFPVARQASELVTPQFQDMMNAITGAVPNLMPDPDATQLDTNNAAPSSVPLGDQTQSPDGAGEGD